MAGQFVGKWGLCDSENFDEYLKTVGVGLLTRKTVATLKSTQVFSVDGDTITLKTISTFKNTEVKFQLGVPFEETTGDGRKMKTTYTMEGNDMVTVQEPVKAGEIGSKFVRTITPEGMTMTCEAAGVKCIRKFAKE